MKKLLLIGMIAILTTGCNTSHNKNVMSPKEVEKLAIKIAIAELNNDTAKMYESIDELNKAGGMFTNTLKVLQLNKYNIPMFEKHNINTKNKSSCALVYYTYQNVKKATGYCK